MTYVNISGYQFKPLTDLENLQKTMKSHCRHQNLKGTILLSEEGINCFLSATREQIDAFYRYIEEKGFENIPFKESPSSEIPFKRMLVKIKPEIITMGIPDISPIKARAPYVSAEELRDWIEKDQDMILLDTRNDYEVSLGKFDNAIDLNIQNFKDFPQAVEKLSQEMKTKKVVTFCTGGIRAEKAALYLMKQGFEDVYQLEGGILKYLELCGKDYYAGECFVFDKRIAVDHTLCETPTVQCFICRQPVIEPLQSSPNYKEGQYCPSCFDTSKQTMD